ncbi:MAG: SDR family NAD(P)-dependent oxidoreductase [Nocardioides sp.]|uniref:SDR family NAD(P)-dependent oxidoreductase n=1 Tax=Nocardioides sp. TaxID=35761 RepID=UPI003EFDBD54
MVAVVTGSSRGIGRAVAEHLAARGVAVVVNGRDESALADTVAAVRAAGGTAVGVPGRGQDEAVVADLAAAAADLGGVTRLVNCLGVPEPVGTSILDVSPAAFDELIAVHLRATFLTCRTFAPLLAEAGGGAIVNTGSHAFLGMYGGTGYAAGKGGVVSLTWAIAADLAEHGVRANVVCPGARTRLSTGPEYEGQIASLHARGLIDDMVRDASLAPAGPEHVAPLYAYLAGPASAPLTGEVFVGSGGYVGRVARPTDEFVAWHPDPAAEPWDDASLAAVLGQRPVGA